MGSRGGGIEFVVLVVVLGCMVCAVWVWLVLGLQSMVVDLVSGSGCGVVWMYVVCGFNSVVIKFKIK